MSLGKKLLVYGALAAAFAAVALLPGGVGAAEICAPGQITEQAWTAGIEAGSANITVEVYEGDEADAFVVAVGGTEQAVELTDKVILAAKVRENLIMAFGFDENGCGVTQTVGSLSALNKALAKAGLGQIGEGV